MSAREAASGQTPPQEERRNGLGLLFLFWLATLVVVLAVWALGVVGGWWMLGVAMLIHLTTTAGVLWGLARALTDRPERSGTGEAPASSPAPQPRVGGHAVTTP